MATPIHQRRKGQRRSRTPRFQIDWQNLGNNGSYRAHAMRTIVHQVPRQIRSLFNWIVRRDGRYLDIGARFRDLAYMKLDLPEPEEWWAVQALGRGGFGAVMMFEKYNNDTGAVLDQIVVKTTIARGRLAAADGDISVSKEAAVMAQTNSSHLDGFVVLRNFKTIFPAPGNPVPGAFDGIADPPASDGDDEDFEEARGNRVEYTWRYYLELCEHGDLERLRVKYKAYGRYLPEPFLWHLFYWLAEGLERYAAGIDNNGDDDPSFRAMTVQDWGTQLDSGYLLHNDIKLMNIFLGSTDGPQPWVFYPIPRIGDMGLADITEGNDSSTRAYNMRKGTAAYMAPEQRYDELDVDTSFYPFGDLPGDGNNISRRHRKAFHHITSAANVAAIGMAMFQMMTLHEHDFLYDRIGQILREEINPGRNLSARNMCIIRMSDMRTQADGPGLQAKYSDDLKLMIMRCLMMNPADRVSEEDLRNHCYGHYQDSIFALPGGVDQQANVERNARVYFAKNDIHNAPMNPGEIRYAFPDWRQPQWWRDIFWRDLMWQQESWGWDRPHDMPNQNDIGMPRWPHDLRPYMVATHTPPPEQDPSHDEITPTPPPRRAQRPVPAPPGPPTPRPLPAIPRPAPLWERPPLVGGWLSGIAGGIIRDHPARAVDNQPESSGGDIPYRDPNPAPPRPQRPPPAQQPFNHHRDPSDYSMNSEEAETDHLGDPGLPRAPAQAHFHDGLTPLRGGANLPTIPEGGTTSLAHNLRNLLGNRRGDTVRRRGAARRDSARPGAEAGPRSSIFNAFGLEVPVLTPGARPGPVRTTQRSSRWDPLAGRGSNARRILASRMARRGGGVGGWTPINRQN